VLGLCHSDSGCSASIVVARPPRLLPGTSRIYLGHCALPPAIRTHYGFQEVTATLKESKQCWPVLMPANPALGCSGSPCTVSISPHARPRLMLQLPFLSNASCHYLYLATEGVLKRRRNNNFATIGRRVMAARPSALRSTGIRTDQDQSVQYYSAQFVCCGCVAGAGISWLMPAPPCWLVVR